jgi:aminocarboxymuconate-semialdehyde decarboxylase
VNGIDIHTHVVPSAFPPSVRPGLPGWPAMQSVDSCRANIIIDGKVYRTLSDQCWTTSRRLEDMDRMEIDLQAISPMPELFSYWMEPASANDLIRFVNDTIAAFVADSKGRMLGFGALPLQDMDLALAELERLKLLGFAGVEIGSNVNGEPLGSPAFTPFFQAIAALDLAVFVHAVRPTGMDRVRGPKPLQQILGYPTDVGLAVASLICANILEQFPSLRIAFSHGGGTFASLLPRFAEGYRVFPAVREMLSSPPVEQAQRFFYDTLVFDPRSLSHLVDIFGEGQLLIGTDYPFGFQDSQPVSRILQTFGDPQLRLRLIRENAGRFLNLRTVSP